VGEWGGEELVTRAAAGGVRWSGFAGDGAGHGACVRDGGLPGGGAGKAGSS
jgi:hypothetical protein